MKATATLILIAGLILCGCTASGGNDGTWLTDFEAAQKTAAKLGRPILLDFSGSDWCYWCKKLDGEVLTQEAFKTYASENLVLVVADFPRKKRLPEATAKQNEALAKRFNVRGFPTLLLLRADGSVIARTGYRKGGAAAYVQHLKDLLER